MNIRRIVMRGFMVHKDTEVAFPERGLVLVTGPNGGGKSSLVESVATAYWGETLRGSDPWAEKGNVEVTSDAVQASRVWDGRRKKLSWCVTEDADSPSETFENTTKAQEALEQVVGDFDVWRRTHVFSSQDAANFTLSTDAERKRLLESILGLDRFDAALAKCRTDLRVAETSVSVAETELGRAEAGLEAQRQRLADAEETLKRMPPVADTPALKAKAANCKKMAKDAESDIASARQELRYMDAEAGQLDARAEEARRRLHALDGDTCDRCGQDIPVALRDKLQAQVAQEKAAAAAVRAKNEQRMDELSAKIEELEAERTALIGRAQTLIAEASAAENATSQRSAAETALGNAQESVTRLERSHAHHSEEAAQHRQSVAVLTAVDTVLGLKGVRAHVLGRALKGLEAAANAWLARVAGAGLVVHLNPYTEKKTGGVSDSISLQIDGAGGGNGYKAASGGERRRIDVALLLALAEVSAAAHGRTPGTLWFDEVFDALDEDGVDSVRDALTDLSQERAVVVITHSKAMVDRLPAALRLRVHAGKVDVG
jgi:DNA repair exonuclease SbcCD ATPase subunit